MIDVRREYDISELNEYQIFKNVMEWILLHDSVKAQSITFKIYNI